MRRTRRQHIGGLTIVLGVALSAIGSLRAQRPPDGSQSGTTSATGRFQLSPDGLTAHDEVLHVTWLVEANLPGEREVQAGEPVVKAPGIGDGSFHNIQPFLYWSCAGNLGQNICSGAPAAPGFEWSFSFGNGFQGTDVIGNSLYVMVSAPDR